MKRQTIKGFTIIELLIVIAIIAILAAITIVSYSTVTARANSSSATAAANQIIKKAEVYRQEPVAQGGTGYYPRILTTLTGASSDKSYQVTGVSGATLTAGTAPATPSTVEYQLCGIRLSGATFTAPTTVAQILAGGETGLIVRYYKYEDSTVQTYSLGTTSGTVTNANGTYTIGCVTSNT